jgi:hypothetical protein
VIGHTVIGKFDAGLALNSSVVKTKILVFALT